MAIPAVLAVNTGSSSLKVALVDGELSPIAAGSVDPVGQGSGRLRLDGPDGPITTPCEDRSPDHVIALERLLDAMASAGLPEPVAVGHRVVHGGDRFAGPVVIDEAVLVELRRLAPLAPLHMPPSIDVIEAVADRLPGAPQVAAFDTAFHRDMPEIAQRFPLDEDLWDEGVRRYGFHGLSYEHALESVPGAREGRVVIAHLGNGASMAAVRDGRPVDTTMGFTPAGGLMMGTRPGDLDPGVVVHLLRTRPLDAAGLGRMLSSRSGLLAVSGLSSDMRTLLDARATDARADLAIRMFCRRARREVGALAALLGGLDLLVFTGGIGENAAPVRAETCDGLEHLGIHIDPDRNERSAPVLSAEGSPVVVRVVHAEEDLVVARHTRDLVAAAP